MNYRSLIFRGLWLASSAYTDGCCERVVVLPHPEVAERVNA